MKYLVIIVIAAIFFFAGRRSAQYVYNPVTKEIESAQAYHSRKKNIVMLGDSHIARGAWVNLLNRCDVGSFGSGGATSVAALAMARHALNARPVKCFVNVGVNDIAGGVGRDEYIGNMDSIISVMAGHCELYVYHIMYTADGYPGFIQFNEKIRDYNIALDSLCALRKVTVINLNALFAPAGTLLSGFTSDNIHLNDTAYKTWSVELDKYL